MTSRPRSLRAVAAALVCALQLLHVVAAPAAAAQDSPPGPIEAGLDAFEAAVTLNDGDPAATVTAGAAAGLIDAGGGLADVDLLTGTLQTDNVLAADTKDHLVVADMMAAGQLAIDAQRNAERARLEAERRRAAEEAARRRAAANTTGQQEVGPDGCPTTAPPNTMRGGSADIGVAELCARSVAQAATPEAARAIKAAFAQLGRPYSQPLRNHPGYFDCSSFVTRAYHSAGVPIAPPSRNAPTTHTILPRAGYTRAPWSVPISAAEARPGDLALPTEGHVVMLLADGFIIHTNQTGDVSHVRRAYGDPVYRRVDPSRV